MVCGEVYRARDTRLGRDVAIKILPRVFTNDPDRLERFEREARMLAALNHPHIGAIYGVEQLDGFPVLILELVEGLTLGERLTSGALSLSETLSIAAQIVDALEAAHSRGIVHRDLKPSNIKITPHGNAKVLDFGLAKELGENLEPPDRIAASTPTPDSASAPGKVLGTVDYMSPEQARGEALDTRTDLFSFGIVLYEMVAAQAAPAGAAARPIVDAILHGTLPAPRRVNPEVTPRLEQIILKLLATDLAARYQNAADVKLNLERLRREIDDGREATEVAPARRRRVFAAVAILGGAIGLLAWAWPRVLARPAPGTDYTQVTDFADSATSPSLSPDGRLLTFIRGESTFEGLGQIYMKALPDGDPVPLTRDRLEKMSPIFSRDGGRIAYTTVNGRFGWDTWIVSVTDREPRRWLVNASGLSWIDRSRVMFSTITNDLHMSVVAGDENQGVSAAATVYSPPSHERGMAHRSSLSPDGQWVLVVEMDAPVWQRCRIVPANGQSAGRRVGPDGQCTSASWSPDGKWMYFSSNTSGAFHIWRQRFPDGASEQITRGPTEEEGVALAPDGQSLLTSVGNRQSSMWVHDAGGEREVSSEGYAFVPTLPSGSPQPFSADGRRLFYLVRRGVNRFSGPEERAGELWMTDLDTGRRESLFPALHVVGYDVSRDGRQIVLAALDERGSSHLWLASLDGRSTPRQLSTLESDNPRFGADGDIFCRGSDGHASFIYRVRQADGHAEKAVASPVLFFVSASPDGAWLIARVAAASRDNQSSQANVAFPTAGGPPMSVCDVCIVDWTPSTKSLVVRLGSEHQPGRTFVIALASPGTLPHLPAGGIHTVADMIALPKSRESKDLVYPGSDDRPEYAYRQGTIRRNIYRVPVP